MSKHLEDIQYRSGQIESLPCLSVPETLQFIVSIINPSATRVPPPPLSYFNVKGFIDFGCFLHVNTFLLEKQAHYLTLKASFRTTLVVISSSSH